MKIKQLLMLCLVFFCVLESQAQNCNELYKQALQKYQDGDVQSAYDLLSQCVEAKKLLGKTEKNLKGDIFWLGTQSSILLKKDKKAKRYLKRMLALRPYYKPDKDDLQDVTALMDELVVRSRLSLRVMGGLTGTRPHVINNYDIFVDGTGDFSSPKNYGDAFEVDVMAGPEFEFTINRQFSIGLGMTISEEQYRYRYELEQSTVEYDVVNDINTGLIDTFQVQTYSLKQTYSHLQDLTYIKFPLSFRLHPISIGRFEPYAEIGGYYGFMLGASKRVDLIEVDSYKVEGVSSSAEQTEVLEDFFTTNVKDMMVLGTYGWFFGTGVNIKIHRTNLFVGMRYQVGMNNIVQQKARYNFEDLTYDLYDIMDDVKLRSGQVFVGWSIPLVFKAYDKQLPSFRRKINK